MSVGTVSDRQGIFRVSGNIYTVSKTEECIEASQLGIRAGHVPEKIEVRTQRTGRRLMYAKKLAHLDRERDLVAVDYICKEHGFKLTVLND